jgi:L,D-transpeptidase ErfK/SrfK
LIAAFGKEKVTEMRRRLAMDGRGPLGQIPMWLALTMSGLLVGSVAFSSVALAEESEWPRGHYPLPEESNVIGETYTVTVEDHGDTLIDIARQNSVGYEEIVRANPGVSIWIPGKGTEVKIARAIHLA